MVVSLVLPWIHLVYVPTDKVTSTYYSPLMAFFLYPSQCANAPSQSYCVGDIVVGFAIVQFPFFLALWLATISLRRQVPYGLVTIAGLVSVGIWAFFAFAASGGEPVWESWPDIGLYVAAIGSFLFLAAYAAEDSAQTKVRQALPE